MHVKALKNPANTNTSLTHAAEIKDKSEILWWDIHSLLRQDTAQGRRKLQAVIIDCFTIRRIDITNVRSLEGPSMARW